MDGASEPPSGGASDGNTLTRGRSWGAKGSLRKNVALDGSADGEGSPLLGDGARSVTGSSRTSSDEDGSVRELEWEGLADFVGLPWWQKPSIYWVVPSFFVFALAFGAIIVPKINLIVSLICNRYYLEQSINNPSMVFAPGDENGPQCRDPSVQALGSTFLLYMGVITGILSAIMSPKLGALSDRHGRLKLLVITSLGALIGEVITIFAAKYPDIVHYNWLLVGSAFDGICGSFTASMALTHAYAADCTPPPKRAVAFGYFHACLFSGIALGPLLVAVIIDHGGTLLTIFYIALGIHAAFIFFVLLVLPESLSKKRQMIAQDKHAAAVAAAENSDLGPAVRNLSWALRRANILEPLKILWPTGPGTSRRLRVNLVLLSAVDTIIFGVAMGSMTVIVLYLGMRFSWDTADTSKFVSAVNIVRVSGLIIVLPLLGYLVRTRRANKQRRESGFAVPEPHSGSDFLDLAIIRTAIFLEVLGYGGYALAGDGKLFVLAGALAALGGIGSPTLQSALTKHVPHDKVGQLLGATGLLHALARIVAPIVFNTIYSKTVGTLPQAVFVVLSASFGVAFLVSWFIRPNVYLVEPGTTANAGRRGADDDTLVDEEITGI
ncbi:MFS general substrate transporter [Venustampulla echinocandica]|uniref:MFS general substrate transporter n=1 Tax=Venustampulla echinocandica TaxID=2656787 RepID=A0A370TL25_9HELO|nr:MFS general substrate transporter [Venustampulla echinocandica]RDL36224.1 MFS general substrate transporter [Venustampulla echinocandica]